MPEKPATHTSLDPLQTNQPSPAAVIKHPKYGSSEFDDCPAATAEEQQFRHSGWAVRRQQVYAALKSISSREARLDRFANCGNSMRLLISEDKTDLKISCNKCGDRMCTACQNERAALIRENIAQLIDANNPRFLTLTLRHSNTPLKDQIDRIYRSFTALRRRTAWKDHVEGGAAFLEIKVGEKDGLWHVHLHCLVTGSFWHQKDISHEWHCVTGDSSIVDIRAIQSSEDAARYVTKYVTKPADSTVFSKLDLLQEFILAIKARRLCLTFGTWRGKELEAVPADSTIWHDVGAVGYLRTRALNGDEEARRYLAAAARKWPLFTALFDRPPPDTPVHVWTFP